MWSLHRFEKLATTSTPSRSRKAFEWYVIEENAQDIIVYQMVSVTTNLHIVKSN